MLTHYIYCPSCGEKVYEDVDGDYLCECGVDDNWHKIGIDKDTFIYEENTNNMWDLV